VIAVEKAIGRIGDRKNGCGLLARLNRAGIVTSAVVVCRGKPAAVPRCHIVRSRELAKDLLTLLREL
jgi:hypothetical protein